MRQFSSLEGRKGSNTELPVTAEVI